MYKTRIQTVEGKYCTDAAGDRLEIVSNITLFPGASVWTDGKFVYGWSWPGAERKAASTGKMFIGLRVQHDDFSQNWPVFAGFTTVIPYYNVKNNVPVAIENPQPYWHGRDVFLCENNTFKAIRGSWTAPILYSGNQQENWHSKALYLNENCYETGDWISAYTEKFYKRVTNSDYVYTVSNERLAVPANYEHYPAYASAEQKDLALHYNDTTMQMDAVLQTILTDIKAKVLQKQALPDDGRAAYPTAQPEPLLTGFALGSFGDLECGNIYNINNWYHTPTDKERAQGGCPAYTVDYSSIPELANYEQYIESFFSRNQDYRRIHNFKIIDGIIHFDVYLLTYYIYYPYCKTLSYDSRYSPAMPQAGAHLWCGAGLRYEGVYHVTAQSGTTTHTCLCERFVTDILYEYPDSIEIGTLVSYNVDYKIAKTEKGSYVLRNHKIIRINNDNEEEILEGTYAWCKEIIEHHKYTYVWAAATTSSSGANLSHVFVFDGTELKRDLWMTEYSHGVPVAVANGTLASLWLAKGYSGLVRLYNILKNIPLYVVDE